MIQFENQVRIARPVGEVFDFVADFENVPKWNYYVRSVTKTSEGPVGMGTIFHQVRKTDEQSFRITVYDPGCQIRIKTIPPSQPAFEMTFTFEPDGNGTRLVDAWKLDTGRPALLERLGAGRIRSAVKENLDKLKVLLEAGEVRLQDGRLVTL